MKALVIISLLLISGCSDTDSWTLIVNSADQTYIEKEIQSGDEIIMSWIHSVEKTPWRETYQVNENGEWVLIETAFESFGAGVSHELGTMTIEDGEVIVRDLEEMVPEITWIHSHNAKYTVYFNEESLIETGDLPHHIPIEIIIEKG
ncbi:DUF1850 domain-containing protein [Alteribacter populi]|uniref:DUF1850 domain-containing protein n=1 Tax=Alteribacter populi TaxID=2011011 RepID=UPI000BBA59BB|nr:DUF1850 domain-containing protein [Alteribacter populi]